MSWRAKSVVLVLITMALSLSVVLPSAAVNPQNPTKPPDPSGGGSCSYCSLPACGCPQPPPGCTGSFSCACSVLQCTQTCNPCV